MEFNVITITLLSVAIVLVLVGAVLLIRFDWFKGWLIGSLGLGALSIALICSIIILSFNSYLSSTQSDSVGTISFTKLAPKHFKVELAETQGEKSSFELKGDLWQIDATILSWSGFFEKQGLKPYYRLNKISSSYAMLSDSERLASTSVKVEAGIADAILKELALSGSAPFLQSNKGSTGALPMRDGALFSIRLNKAGLISKPENQQAFSSIR
jgi:hypothetical protein